MYTSAAGVRDRSGHNTADASVGFIANMKVVVLGATGGTGTKLLEQCLERGHDVTAVARSPDKLDAMCQKQPKLRVVQADVTSAESLAPHVADADVVISTLGFSLRNKPVTGYLSAARAVVEALRARPDSAGQRRFVVMHSWYTNPQSRSDASGMFLRWFLLPLIKPVLDNMHEAEAYLASVKDDISYTVVLPAGLTNGPKTDGQIVAKEGAYSMPGKGERMARADVARFLLKVAEEKSYEKKVVAIAV